MKRFISLLLILLIVSACGNINENNDKNKEKQNVDHLTIYGGSVGGVWSIFTEGVSEAFRREYPGTLINAIPGTVAGNPILIDQGKTDFAIAESLTAQFAYKGHNPFREKHENIRAVAAIIPENVFQMVAPANVSFDSVEDIVNDEISIRYSAGEKDALGDIISKSIFESYDLTYEDIGKNGGEVNFLSGGKTFELMQDNRIDSLGKMVPIPAGDIIEAAATMDMKLIPIGQTAIEYLVEVYELTPFVIKKGSYDFQEEDYLTVNTPTILITNASMSEEVVYQMTKSIYNQLAYLADVHHGFKAINNQTITDVGGVRLHPGAERFFQEQGLLD